MQPLTTPTFLVTAAAAAPPPSPQDRMEREREEAMTRKYGMAPRRRPKQSLLLSRRSPHHSRTPSPSNSDDDFSLRIPERGQSISSFSGGEDMEGSASDSSACDDMLGAHNTIPLSSVPVGGDTSSSRRPTRATSAGAFGNNASSRNSSSSFLATPVTQTTTSSMTGPAFLDHLVAVETLEHKRRHERRYFDSADWVMSVRGLMSPLTVCTPRSEPYDSLPTCYRVHQHITTEGSLRELALATLPTSDDPQSAGQRVVGQRLTNESARSRVYFDSADYEMSGHKLPLPWQLAYKGQEAPQPSTATASHYLNAHEKGRKYFDSADYGLFLAGVHTSLTLPTSPRKAAVLEANRPNAAFATVVPEDEHEHAVTSRHQRRSHKTKSSRQRGKASSVY